MRFSTDCDKAHKADMLLTIWTVKEPSNYDLKIYLHGKKIRAHCMKLSASMASTYTKVLSKTVGAWNLGHIYNTWRIVWSRSQRQQVRTTVTFRQL